jgi:hypothetical protein
MIPGENSPSSGNVILVKIPMMEKASIINMGTGVGHSFAMGATIVTDLAIIPQVPTEVFLLDDGKILSSVKETWVVMMKLIIIPILRQRIKKGITCNSKVSLYFLV